MKTFKDGLKDSIPIGLGYLAVSFSLGIVASSAGISVFKGVITSALLNASAGESVFFTAIKENVPYIQIALVTLVANARYILMSFAMSQKIKPNEKLINRLMLGFYLTDEYFGLAISQDDYINPNYSYGAICFASPCWVLGTVLGIIFGNILPPKTVIALSISLYAMFLAIIIPPIKKDKKIAILITISFISSYFLNNYTTLSSSLITILITIIISTLGALLLPIKDQNNEQ